MFFTHIAATRFKKFDVMVNKTAVISNLAKQNAWFVAVH